MDTVQKVVDDGKTVAKVQYEATSRWIGDAAKKNPVRALSIVAAAGLGPVLLAVAGTGAACGAAIAACRYLSDGKWAAGYWWSKRDRERGPGN